MAKSTKFVSLCLIVFFILPIVPVFSAEKIQESLILNDQQLTVLDSATEIITEQLTPERQAELDMLNNNILIPEEEPLQADTVNEESASSEETYNSRSSTSTYATTSSPKEFLLDAVNNPYNFNSNINESVSLYTGAMNYEHNIVSLPGRNDFDLNLGIRYNSYDAAITSNIFASDSLVNSTLEQFAIGWSFNMPYISINKSKYGFKKSTTLFFGDGSSYEIDTDLSLKNYTLDDLVLTKTDTPNEYTLTYANGTVYKFDGSHGGIISIKDRFENKINFEYAPLEELYGSFTDYYFRPSYYRNNIQMLSKITDTLGREININYDFIPTRTGKNLSKIHITQGEKLLSTIVLSESRSYNGKVDVLKSITDAEGNTTEFEYEEGICHYYYCVLRGDEEDYSFVMGSNYLLKKVVYPTGGHTEYTYDKYNERTDYNESYNQYKVSRLTDSNGKVIEYNYQNDKKTTNYTYVTQNGRTTVYTFDKNGLKISEETYDNSTTRNLPVLSKGESLGSVISNGYIYRLGYFKANSNNGRFFFYKESTTGGNTEFSSYSPLASLESIDVGIEAVRILDNKIYVFVYPSTTPTYQKYTVRTYTYDIENDTWDSDSSESVHEDYENLLSDSLKYTNGMFYSLKVEQFNGGAKISSLTYDVDGESGEKIKTANSSTGYIALNDDFRYSFVYCGAIGNVVYFRYKNNIYMYDLVTNSISKTKYDSLSEQRPMSCTIVDGYIYSAENATVGQITKLNLSTGEVTTYNSSSYSGLYQGPDGRIYTNIQSDDDRYSIYYFNPNSQGGEPWIFLTNTLSPITTGRMFFGNNEIYFETGYDIDPLYCGAYEKIILDTSTSSTATNKSRNRVDYTYDTDKRLTNKSSVVYSSTATKSIGNESWEYVDDYNYPTNHIDILGNKTTYTYDETYYLPTTTTIYAGTTDFVRTTYTLSSDKTKIVSSSSSYDDRTIITDYEYNDSEIISGETVSYPGNVTKEILKEQLYNGTINTLRTTEYEYETDLETTEHGYVTKKTIKNVVTNDVSLFATSLADFSENYTYYFDTGLVKSVTNAEYMTTSYEYDKNGNITKVTNPDGTSVITSYTVGKNNNSITQTYPNGYVLINRYDDLGNIASQSEKITGSTKLISEYEYQNGNLHKVTQLNGLYEIYEYDVFDRVKSCTTFSSDDIQLRSEVYAYDDYERTKSISGKTVERFTYDIAGREIQHRITNSTNVYSNSYTHYDNRGNVIKTVSPKNEETLYSYNDACQLVSTTNALNETTSYEYDSYGNVSKVTTSGGSIISYEYDSLGRLLKQTDALGNSETYAYDKIGNVVSSKDRNGTFSTYTYKPGTNYVQNLQVGTSIEDYNVSVSYTYDNMGNRLTMTDITGTTSYEYRKDGLLTKMTVPDGKSISYSYDIMKNVSAVTNYDGITTNYTYDELNQMMGVKQNNDYDLANYTYDTRGNMTSFTYSAGTINYTYDLANRVTGVVHAPNGTNIVNLSYTYDLNGNVLTETAAKNNSPSEITTYTYDSLGRLSTETLPDGTSTALTYDANNNILSKNITHPTGFVYNYSSGGTENTLADISAHSVNYTYNGANRLTQMQETIISTEEDTEQTLSTNTNFTYDLNGNMLSKTSSGHLGNSVANYTYDKMNRLIRYNSSNITEATYTYNGDGMRTRKMTDSSILYYWDRGYVANEGTIDGITTSNYIGANGIFASQYDNQHIMEAPFYIKDAHGDVLSVMSRSGVLKNEYSYDAWGNTLTESETAPYESHIRYAGEYMDLCSGLIYLRNRYYDPSIGRFISEDPARDGLNWYVYCENNPVNRIDPLGLESYVFYTTGKNSDFSSQAQWQKDRLENMGEKVIMIPVTDVKTFEDGWNGMGMVDGKSVDINYVMIYTHGNHRSMIFESGSSTKAMSINGKNSSGRKIGNVNDLQEKEIKELNLLSCNAGNLLTYYNEKENLASVLSKKVINGNTYAYDGNVSFGKSPWDIFGKDIGKSSRLATNQHGFNEIAKKYNVSGRKPLGKITYYNGEYKPYGYYPNTSIWAN